MSRIISSEIQEQLESSQLFPYFLYEFQDNGANWWKYTSLDVSQWFTHSEGPSGQFYPLGFEFESITYSVGNIVDDASMRIDNLDQIMSALFVGDVLQGNTARIYAGVLDPDGKELGTMKIFEGEIDSWELDETEMRLTLASLFTKWDAKSYGKHSSSCRWKVFRGVECQYAGDAVVCDRSYTRCDELTNTERFGGFRFLPELENKTIWWGPTPAQRQDED
jgi:hypothetical protein